MAVTKEYVGTISSWSASLNAPNGSIKDHTTSVGILIKYERPYAAITGFTFYTDGSTNLNVPPSQAGLRNFVNYGLCNVAVYSRVGGSGAITYMYDISLPASYNGVSTPKLSSTNNSMPFNLNNDVNSNVNSYRLSMSVIAPYPKETRDDPYLSSVSFTQTEKSDGTITVKCRPNATYDEGSLDKIKVTYTAPDGTVTRVNSYAGSTSLQPGTTYDYSVYILDEDEYGGSGLTSNTKTGTLTTIGTAPSTVSLSDITVTNLTPVSVTASFNIEDGDAAPMTLSLYSDAACTSSDFIDAVTLPSTTSFSFDITGQTPQSTVYLRGQITDPDDSTNFIYTNVKEVTFPEIELSDITLVSNNDPITPDSTFTLTYTTNLPSVTIKVYADSGEKELIYTYSDVTNKTKSFTLPDEYKYAGVKVSCAILVTFFTGNTTSNELEIAETAPSMTHSDVINPTYTTMSFHTYFIYSGLTILRAQVESRKYNTTDTPKIHPLDTVPKSKEYFDFTIDGLKQNTNYQFTIRLFTRDNEYTFGLGSNRTNRVALPSMQGPTVTSLSNGFYPGTSVLMEWIPPVSPDPINYPVNEHRVYYNNNSISYQTLKGEVRTARFNIPTTATPGSQRWVKVSCLINDKDDTFVTIQTSPNTTYTVQAPPAIQIDQVMIIGQTKNSISLLISPEESDNSTVSKYYASDDGGTTWVSSTTPEITVSGLTPNTAYTLKVKIEDSYGQQSNIKTVTSETLNPAIKDYRWRIV